MQKHEFLSKLKVTIQAKFQEIMAGKPHDQKFLNYGDSETLCFVVQNVFRNRLNNVVPPQVEAACHLSKAVLAPSAKEKIRLIKAAVGLAGGATGMAMIISALAMALHWGASVTTLVIAFFTGTALTGPICIGAAGLAAIAIAGYFAFSGSPEKDTEHFLNALTGSVCKASEVVWDQHQDMLSRD